MPEANSPAWYAETDSRDEATLWVKCINTCLDRDSLHADHRCSWGIDRPDAEQKWLQKPRLASWHVALSRSLTWQCYTVDSLSTWTSVHSYKWKVPFHLWWHVFLPTAFARSPSQPSWPPWHPWPKSNGSPANEAMRWDLPACVFWGLEMSEHQQLH